MLSAASAVIECRECHCSAFVTVQYCVVVVVPSDVVPEVSVSARSDLIIGPLPVLYITIYIYSCSEVFARFCKLFVQ